MKKATFYDEEATQLAEVLCSDSTSDTQVNRELDKLTSDDVQEICTTILNNGHTIVHQLAQRQKLSALQAVLERGVNVHTRNAQGRTPLHVAFTHNALQAASILMEHGANVEEVVSRRKGILLLHLMVACDRPRAVTLLLEAKADANVRDGEGRTPLHLAAIYGNITIALLMVRHQQCDANAKDASGHTALMIAILNNNQELARRLVECPQIDTISRDRAGMSPLHMAVAHGQLEVVRSILNRNTANINGREGHMGRTPMHFACALHCTKDGTVSCSGNLQESSSSLEQSSQSRENAGGGSLSTSESDSTCDICASPPTLSAVTENDVAIDSTAESFKENVPFASTMSQSSFLTRSEDEKGQEFQSLQNISESGNLTTVHTGNSIHWHQPSTSENNLQRDSIRSEKSLTSSNPRMRDVHSEQEVSQSATDQLLESSSKQQLFISTPYSKSQANVEVDKCLGIRRPVTAPTRLPSKFDSLIFRIPRAFKKKDSATYGSRKASVLKVTPLNIGIVRSRIVGLLLEYGADPNLMTLFRKSPLHLAAAQGAASIVQLLLPRISNINMLSTANKTALHFAAQNGHAAVVSQLILAGANLDLRDVTGMTALHIAAEQGHYKTVRLLLKGNANSLCYDFQQMTPADYAFLHGHTQIVNLLNCRAIGTHATTSRKKFPPHRQQSTKQMTEKEKFVIQFTQGTEDSSNSILRCRRKAIPNRNSVPRVRLQWGFRLNPVSTAEHDRGASFQTSSRSLRTGSYDDQ